jgi:ribosomal protein L3 glutamine methyltransferase
LLIEVGGLRAAMEVAFGHLHPRWLATKDGTNCVCLLEARRLPTIPPPDNMSTNS